MRPSSLTERLDRARNELREILRDARRRQAALAYADARLAATEARAACAEDGDPRGASAEETLALGVRAIAGPRGCRADAHEITAAGHVGLVLGSRDLDRLPAIVIAALERAARRARASAAHKLEVRGKFGRLGEALAPTALHPIAVREAVCPATFRTDPRDVTPGELARHAASTCRSARGAAPAVRHVTTAIRTELQRELFASSEGSLIDQWFAVSQGSVGAVAVTATATEEHWDSTGHQRGWECLLDGATDGPLETPPFEAYAVALARDAAELAAAPRLPAGLGEATVVVDPHYTALLAHEILGHPTELDRVLKLETGYAGRSWLLRDLDDHEVGRRVASPLVSAWSDPELPGWGHYAYDHEGTPARRVSHIERGILCGFLNSRGTALRLGGAPNGHALATDASLVPLVRMSTTVFAGGERSPGDIVAEVDRGWYLAGHRVPSIAESREHFRISARRVYAIERGQLGQLYGGGGLSADSRSFLEHVDAIGNDFRVVPIANCGKGQPMQSRRLGNGGATMRGRASITGEG